MSKTKRLKYLLEDDSYLKNLSNEVLLDEVLDRSRGDDYDGCFTTRGINYYNNSLDKLKERLGDWISND